MLERQNADLEGSRAWKAAMERFAAHEAEEISNTLVSRCAILQQKTVILEGRLEVGETLFAALCLVDI